MPAVYFRSVCAGLDNAEMRKFRRVVQSWRTSPRFRSAKYICPYLFAIVMMWILLTDYIGIMRACDHASYATSDDVIKTIEYCGNEVEKDIVNISDLLRCIRAGISPSKTLWNNTSSSLQGMLQRRLVAFTKEVWFAATAYLKLLEASISSIVFSNQTENRPVQLISSLRTYIKDISMSILVNLHLLKHVDGSYHSQISGLEELSTLVQRRIRRLQNPTDCRKAKLLLVDLEDHYCGFGCQVHYLTYCFQVAYATGRTLLMKPNQKGFGKWWMENFEEFSETCKANDTANQEVEKLLYETVNSSTRVMQCAWKLHLQRQKLHAAPEAVPEDLAPKLSIYHGQPSAWFVGQLASYLTRPGPVLKRNLEELTLAYNFTESDRSPVVGIHVRRTDKIIFKEADFHAFSEYMIYVERYFDFLEYQRHVAEDYQICRIAYELMQTRHRSLGDASFLAQSLDSAYFVYGGQRTPCKMTDRDDKNGLRPGDLVHVVGSHLDGYLEVSQNQGQSEIRVPAYKCRPLILTSPM